MKKIILPLAFAAMIVSSCGGDKNPAAGPVPVTRTEMNSEVVKTVANLKIEGMTCSDGCGGKIQQELRALNGVKTTDLDYADKRAENIVSVEYDPGQVTEQDMIQCVNAIADGMYQVKAVEIVQYKGLQGTGGGSTSDSGVSTNEFGKLFQLLNLLESVNKMMQR